MQGCPQVVTISLIFSSMLILLFSAVSISELIISSLIISFLSMTTFLSIHCDFNSMREQRKSHLLFLFPKVIIFLMGIICFSFTYYVPFSLFVKMLYKEVPLFLLLTHVWLGTVSSGLDIISPTALADYHHIHWAFTWFHWIVPYNSRWKSGHWEIISF